MSNAIKYSTTGDTLSLKKGNIFFGVGDVGKGPSSATTYYNGVTPSAGGYTIYSYNESQTSKLSFHSAVDDAALRDYTNRVSGQSFASAAQCLNWYATQTNYVCVNRDYEGIVTNGLVLNLDAGFTPSYTTSGITWYDLSYGGNNGTLINGPSYSTEGGGSIVFDGTNDVVYTIDPGYPSTGTNSFSIEIVFRIPTDATWSNGGSGTSIIGRGSYAGSIGIIRSSTINQVSFWVRLNGGIIFNPSITNMARDQFHHVLGTYDSSGVAKIYHNGNFITEQTGSSDGTFGSGNYRLGGNVAFGGVNGGYGQGDISLTRVYNRALSATEVLQNFNAQKSRFGL